MIKILYYKFYYLFLIWVRFYSSKYHQFIIFEKVIFIKDKKHLSKEGKLEMIIFYHELKKPYLAPLNNNTQLTIHWLGGFTDGDASFLYLIINLG